MKIELEQNNKVFIFEGSNKWELHPIWLRERVSEKEHLDNCLLYTSPSPRDP